LVKILWRKNEKTGLWVKIKKYKSGKTKILGVAKKKGGRLLSKKRNKEKKTRKTKMPKVKTRKTESKTRVMPKALQVKKIKEWLRRKGIDPQSIDVEALVDETLTYNENLANVKKYVMQGEPSLEETYAEMLRYASWLHNQRSERSQIMDENLRAKVVISTVPSPYNIALLNKWLENPARYDIEGIDVHFDSKTRKRRCR